MIRVEIRVYLNSNITQSIILVVFNSHPKRYYLIIISVNWENIMCIYNTYSTCVVLWILAHLILAVCGGTHHSATTTVYAKDNLHIPFPNDTSNFPTQWNCWRIPQDRATPTTILIICLIKPINRREPDLWIIYFVLR